MYSTIFNAHLLPAFGGRQMRSITPNEIQAFLNTKASSKSKVDQIYMVLRQVFKAAHSQGIIDRNPTDLLKKPIAPEGKQQGVDRRRNKSRIARRAQPMSTDCFYFCFIILVRAAAKCWACNGGT